MCKHFFFYSIFHFLCSIEIPGDYSGLLQPLVTLLVSLLLVSLTACKSIRGEWIRSDWQPVYAGKSLDDRSMLASSILTDPGQFDPD